MRNSVNENLSEHSLETAFIAHLLAVIRNRRFKGNVDPEAIAVYAMYHDVSEIITGDLPTPVKYHDPEIKAAYKQMEKESAKRLVSLLPEDLRDEYMPFVTENADDETLELVKAADKLSALIKCVEERKMGNPEFDNAYQSTLKYVKAMKLPEIKVFLDEFLPAFSLTLDDFERN